MARKKQDRSKQNAQRTTSMAIALQDFWKGELDEAIIIWQARRYTPHQFASEWGEVARQKLDAWSRRDWIWMVREEVEDLSRDWAKMRTTVRLTEQGQALLAAMRPD